jgi:predicted GH43/DUF377 family glycosyl hydrolase
LPALGVAISFFGTIPDAVAEEPADGHYFVLAPSTAPGRPAPLKIDHVWPAPVLTRGSPGQWDGVDVLNPSVIRFQGKLWNFYSGFDGKVWRTGAATSADGVTWTKAASNPVLAPAGNSDGDWDVGNIAANGAAVVVKEQILYFYQGVDRFGKTHIGLARSKDGVHFTKTAKPVFVAGAAHGWESDGVADPYVIEKNDILYLYYLGQDELQTQRLGIARSKDGGATWERFVENPILDVGAYGTFDQNGLGEPSVASVPPYFFMLYTGRDKSENRNLGYAISGDGVHWKKMSTAGLLSARQRGAWASKVICDSTLLSTEDGKWTVWFGGGDRADPAQNINGQIGMMTIALPHSAPDTKAAWIGKRLDEVAPIAEQNCLGFVDEVLSEDAGIPVTKVRGWAYLRGRQRPATVIGIVDKQSHRILGLGAPSAPGDRPDVTRAFPDIPQHHLGWQVVIESSTPLADYAVYALTDTEKGKAACRFSEGASR